jgi:hypothetical protein
MSRTDGLYGSHHIAVMKLGQAGFMRGTCGLIGYSSQ